MHVNAIGPRVIGEMAQAEARGNARLDAIEAKLDRLLELLDRPAEAPPGPAAPQPRKAR